MKSVKEIFTCKYEIKKSTFIAYLTPYSDFHKLKDKLKEENPKANHIVWAFRILNQYDQIVENSSDDKEPKGTSGPPILNVLRGANLVQCGVLVVRYFGGIKLGTGGLVRAYSSSCNEVIKNANLVNWEKLSEIKFFTPFNLIQRFEYFFQANDFLDNTKDFDQNGAIWTMQITNNQEKTFSNFANEYKLYGFKFI